MNAQALFERVLVALVAPTPNRRRIIILLQQLLRALEDGDELPLPREDA